jgi:hypothetical protein
MRTEMPAAIPDAGALGPWTDHWTDQEGLGEPIAKKRAPAAADALELLLCAEAPGSEVKLTA